jgi:hypothetical protein
VVAGVLEGTAVSILKVVGYPKVENIITQRNTIQIFIIMET